MVQFSHTLSYGPQDVDSILSSDGSAAIDRIGQAVRASLTNGVQVVCLSLRTTNENPRDNDRRLRSGELEQVRERLRSLFVGCSICVVKNGNLEVAEGERNYLHPTAVKRDILSHCGSLVSNPDSAFDVSDSFWEDHLYGSNAALAERRRNMSCPLSRAATIGSLNGKAAEFLMQHILERYLVLPSNPRDTQARLVDRHHGITLPEGRLTTDPHFSLRFRTRYNCELHKRQMVGSRSSRHTMSEFETTLTEFDAVVTTGLDPDHPSDYTTLFVFDSTTFQQIEVKISDKKQKMNSFVESMRSRGIDVHVFHVLLHDKRQRDLSCIELPSNTHLITLPLLPLVSRVAHRTAKELKVKIPG